MKRVIDLFLIALLSLFCFNSCEQQSEVPGGIPGMGETPGELEIREPFNLPAGVTCEIKGGDMLTMTDLINSEQTRLKSSSTFVCDKIYGSGGSFYGEEFKFWIIVRLTFNNMSDVNRRITLKDGLIFKVLEEGYQNGILLNKAIFYVKPYTTRTVCIAAYCLNRGRDGSNEDLHYTIPGVTDSDVLWENLLSSLENRKVNIENFITPPGLPSSLKAVNDDGIEKYMEIADHLQNMVWTLTNDGKELSREQKDYLESLPFVEE